MHCFYFNINPSQMFSYPNPLMSGVQKLSPCFRLNWFGLNLAEPEISRKICCLVFVHADKETHRIIPPKKNFWTVCAEVAKWLLAQSPRPGLFGLSLPLINTWPMNNPWVVLFWRKDFITAKKYALHFRNPYTREFIFMSEQWHRKVALKFEDVICLLT